MALERKIQFVTTHYANKYVAANQLIKELIDELRTRVATENSYAHDGASGGTRIRAQGAVEALVKFVTFLEDIDIVDDS